MAVIFMDSANGGDGVTRWDTFALQSVQVGISPSGRDAYRRSTGGSGLIKILSTPIESALCGWYGRLSALTQDGSNSAQLFRLHGPTDTLHLTMTVTPAGEVRVRRGTGAGDILATSAPGVVTVDSWHHYEVRAEIEDTGGRVEVWVDGTQRIDFTGDTRDSGTDTEVGTIHWGRPLSGVWDMSDLRIGDDTTPLGVTQVWHHLPDGDGNQTDLTPEPAGDNFQNVNEATPDGDSSYNHSDTEGDYDLYTIDGLPAGNWDVLAVQTVLNARVESGGAAAIRPAIRSDGSEAQGSTDTLSAAYRSYMEVFMVNPVTTDPWDEMQINDIEFGPEVRDV